MATWRILTGPREFQQLGSFDMDIGWGYTLGRVEDGEQQIVSVIVAGGRLGSAELPHDAQQAVRTRGRTAVEAVLDRESPPRYLTISTTGIGERAT